MAKKRGKRTANQPSSTRSSRAPSQGRRAPSAALAEAPSSRRLELVEQHEQDERLESGEHTRVAAPAKPSTPPAISGVSVVDDAPASADMPLAEPMRAKAPSDPDEISIPPAADVDMEKFFAEGDSTPLLPEAGPGSHHDLHDFEEPPRSVRHLEPEVAERRAFFAKRVRWVVAVAAVLGLAGFVRGALSHSSGGSDTPASQTGASVAAAAAPKTVEQPAPVVKPAEPVAAPKAAEPAKADEPKPVEAKADEAKPADKPSLALAAGSAADEAKSAAVEPAAGDKPAKTAGQEKVDSRRALEAGRAADAIAAGERSVALDPSDGEAWLILGAAYQEKGRGGDARKAFASCVKQGKRGPVSECAAMLQ